MKRVQNPAFFCEKAIENIDLNEKDGETFKIWIITDARRQTDLNYFKALYPNQFKTVRIHADDHIRSARNWTFIPGNITKIVIIKKNNYK